jgi:hypothetical protein
MRGSVRRKATPQGGEGLDNELFLRRGSQAQEHVADIVGDNSGAGLPKEVGVPGELGVGGIVLRQPLRECLVCLPALVPMRHRLF